MARSCTLTASDTTPDYGQPVVITATFSNDSVAVDIDEVQPLMGPGVAGFYEQMQEHLVGQSLLPEDGGPVDTTFTFPVIMLTGQEPTFTIEVDFAVRFSDGTVINATGVTLTIAPPTLPGGTFPE